VELMPFSAATRTGLTEILEALEAVLRETDPSRATSDSLDPGERPQDLHTRADVVGDGPGATENAGDGSAAGPDGGDR
jgi:hypothetical protein